MAPPGSVIFPPVGIPHPAAFPGSSFWGPANIGLGVLPAPSLYTGPSALAPGASQTTGWYSAWPEWPSGFLSTPRALDAWQPEIVVFSDPAILMNTGPLIFTGGSGEPVRAAPIAAEEGAAISLMTGGDGVVRLEFAGFGAEGGAGGSHAYLMRDAAGGVVGQAIVLRNGSGIVTDVVVQLSGGSIQAGELRAALAGQFGVEAGRVTIDDVREPESLPEPGTVMSGADGAEARMSLDGAISTVGPAGVIFAAASAGRGGRTDDDVGGDGVHLEIQLKLEALERELSLLDVGDIPERLAGFVHEAVSSFVSTGDELYEGAWEDEVVSDDEPPLMADVSEADISGLLDLLGGVRDIAREEGVLSETVTPQLPWRPFTSRTMRGGRLTLGEYIGDAIDFAHGLLAGD